MHLVQQAWSIESMHLMGLDVNKKKNHPKFVHRLPVK